MSKVSDAMKRSKYYKFFNGDYIDYEPPKDIEIDLVVIDLTVFEGIDWPKWLNKPVNEEEEEGEKAPRRAKEDNSSYRDHEKHW
jgi:hypothetical protein